MMPLQSMPALGAMQAPLWPFQTEVSDCIETALSEGRRRLLVVVPTGGGKTVLFTKRIRRESDRGRRVLVLVHRRELLQQASLKLFLADIDHGVIAAGFAERPGAAVQIA